jgi:phosphate transport system substrate-binding protein
MRTRSTPRSPAPWLLTLALLVPACDDADGDASRDAGDTDSSDAGDGGDGGDPVADTPAPGPEVTLETYPRVDGSTSTLPLARALASELLGLPYRWVLPEPVFGEGAEEMVLVPLPTTLEERALAAGILRRIVHAKTHQAFLNLIDGETDLILVASPPSEDERAYADEVGVTLRWETIALDALVFMASAESPLGGLTTAQLVGIYTGEITGWAEVGGPERDIHPYVRPRNSGSQQLMDALVLQGREVPEWPADRLIGGMGGLVDMLKADVDGLGYSVYYYVTHQYSIHGLKRIAVDGFLPDPDTIRAGSYPHSAPVLVVTREDLEPSSLAGQLREWLFTPEGQRVIQSSGYIPVGEVAPSRPLASVGPVCPAEPASSSGGLAGDSCDPWARSGNGGCGTAQYCVAEWEGCHEVSGRCEDTSGWTPGALDAPCWGLWGCGSGLACSGDLTRHCRPVCHREAEPALGEPCPSGQRCFHQAAWRWAMDSETGATDHWVEESALGFCATPCTPGRSECPLGSWCQPRELDVTGAWLGECSSH